jgi:hypothetical protein
VVWIVSGIYLFATIPGIHFFSVQALIFFTVGSLVAGVGFGILAFLAHWSITWALVYVIGMPGPKTGRLITLLGIGLMVAQTVIVYRAARHWVGVL